jgi:S-adenosylmethionine hydrolase
MTVVTFTTDFGLADPYAAAMKGVVLSLAPDATLVDISHEIPRHDVVAGALALAQAAPYFPPGSIHVAVIDPGVGGGRAEIVVEASGRLFVGPDNGVLSLAAPPPRTAYRIENSLFRRDSISPTFHGRDVFAPAAGRLASGHAARAAGAPIPAIVDSPIPDGETLQDDCQGVVLYIDSFGNLLTSLVGIGLAKGHWEMICGGRSFDLQVGRTFCDVERGNLVLYMGSSGRVEVAVREGSAAALTQAQPGTQLHLRRRS